MNRLARLIQMAGAGLLLAALLLVAYNLWDDQRAAWQSEKAFAVIQQVRQKKLEDESFQMPQTEDNQLPFYDEFPNVEMPVIESEGTHYIGTLVIPSRGLSLAIIDKWSYPNLKKSPCRYSGSVYTRDLVLCAHNHKGHFGCLSSLKQGTRLQFSDCDGNVFTYEVRGMEFLQPEEIEAIWEGEWDLTLFTCTVGGKNRVVIRCALVDTIPVSEM